MAVVSDPLRSVRPGPIGSVAATLSRLLIGHITSLWPRLHCTELFRVAWLMSRSEQQSGAAPLQQLLLPSNTRARAALTPVNDWTEARCGSPTP
jgi:hypothetical protein